ncbi:MAG: hypothetical protein ACHQET_11680 [Chitinophagales bacterium]
MNNILSNEEQALIGTSSMPCVSIILPFEPKMSLKAEVALRLKSILQKVEIELNADYPPEKALPVIDKLRRVIHQLNYNTHKQSIAIFASPLNEKVFYLDIPVEEKIVIDESFEIRDLVYSKKQNIKYLVLLLSGKSSKMYLGNCSSFILIKSNIPNDIEAYERDMPSQVANFSDLSSHKEIVTDNFLHHMDEGLTLVLKAYPLPVFVMGTDKVIGHFKKMTRNEQSIIEYIHGNYEEASEAELRLVMKPYTAEWKKIREQAVLKQIEAAMDEKKLSIGIDEVWASTSHKNGRILIVEKDFMYPAHLGANAETIYKQDMNLENPFYIKDAVDDIIERILENGGDVEFVDNGALRAYNKIALVRYY